MPEHIDTGSAKEDLIVQTLAEAQIAPDRLLLQGGKQSRILIESPLGIITILFQSHIGCAESLRGKMEIAQRDSKKQQTAGEILKQVFQLTGGWGKLEFDWFCILDIIHIARRNFSSKICIHLSYFSCCC